MNQQAERHLGRAEELFARGDGKYHEAAQEIVTAKEVDPTLTNLDIARRLGRSDRWIGDILKWHRNGSTTVTPYSGSEMSGKKDEEKTKRVLREAPMEQVEKIVAALPASRVAQIAAAALERPGVTQELAKDADASATVTRASTRIAESDAHQSRARARAARGDDSAVGGLEFLVEVMAGIRGAKRKLYDSYTAARDHKLKKDQREAAHELLDELVTIVDWYRSYLNDGDRSFEEELAQLLND